ncbi:MAG: hypothetical protein LBG44_04430 [Gemmatimonadota bacterium]|nr:hypothetical protein [Gemmatimonadota bacterium]
MITRNRIGNSRTGSSPAASPVTAAAEAPHASMSIGSEPGAIGRSGWRTPDARQESNA